MFLDFTDCTGRVSLLVSAHFELGGNLVQLHECGYYTIA